MAPVAPPSSAALIISKYFQILIGYLDFMMNNCKFKQKRVREGQDNAEIELGIQSNPNATTSSPNIPKDNTSEQIEEVLSCRCCSCMNCIEKQEIQVAIDLIRFIVGILSVVIFALGFSEESK